MDEFLKALNRIKFLAEGIKEDKKMSYRIEVASINDKTWQYAREGKLMMDLSNQIEKTAEALQPDAIRVLFLNNNRVNKTEIIKLTNTFIPLVDEDNSVTILSEKSNKREEQPHEHMFITALNGISERQDNLALENQKNQYEHTIQINEINAKHELERRDDRIKTLDDRIAELYETVNELNEKVAYYENLITEQNNSKGSSEQSKLVTMGTVMTLGKIMGFDKKEILGLAGLAMGEDMPEDNKDDTKQLTEKSENNTEHSEQNAKEKQKDVDIQKIASWLDGIEEELFHKISQLLMDTSKNPLTIDVALLAIQHFEKANQTPQEWYQEWFNDKNKEIENNTKPENNE